MGTSWRSAPPSLRWIIVNGEAPATVFADVNQELSTAAGPILEDLKAVEG